MVREMGEDDVRCRSLDIRVEGTVPLPDGRQLGFAAYGPDDGDPVIWHHGTPGARGQIAPRTSRVAAERNMQVVLIERPGVGDSTSHLYENIAGFAPDVEVVADRLGFDRFGVAGLSGGGPYTLACAHHMPDRVVAAAVLGGVSPTTGEDAPPGGIVRLAHRFNGPLTALRDPLSAVVWTALQVAKPVDDQAIALYARISPPKDREILTDPEMKEMFISDINCGGKRQFKAVIYDAVLFGRHWGFEIEDLQVPVRMWHGDADNLVPLAHAEWMADLIPDCELTMDPGEAHLGGLDRIEDVRDTISDLWADRPGAGGNVHPITATDEA